MAACAAAAALCVLPLRAEEATPHSTAQRDRFAACAHETRGMKPEQHREYMSECLKKHADGTHGVAHAAGDSADGPRLQPCNAEADRRKLHGDERSAFVGACLRS
jgi:hypothetical protein